MKVSFSLYVIVVFLLAFENAFSQFSPGDLSRAHAKLEGMNNCLQCHEAGNEISGKKCLTCHVEIKSSIEGKSGYHFRVSSQGCVACHKEHLGRDAQTVLFDKNAFDHSQTGFSRSGKHALIDCEDCHSKKNIKREQVLKIISVSGRQTYLGLSAQCISCHEDRHNGSVGKECQACHGTKAWSPVVSFDHAKTEFKLIGKHATVMCNKCHMDLDRKAKDKPLVFATQGFRDCTPCHTSPHSASFAKQSCNSCHSPEDWKTSRQSSKFNHDLTAFKLVGKHAALACEKCHKPGADAPAAGKLKLAHNRCLDCHADYHAGEFAAKYNNDCTKCHTVFGFAPSTFTISAHSSTRFALTGAHVATPCEKCHVRGSDGRRRFEIANTRCESCHKDKHSGQFAKEMEVKSCASCHSTEDWLPKSFDHSKTNFVLLGRHAQTKCSGCHKAKAVNGLEVVQYKNTNTKCESCHKEVHAGQFSVFGETNCAMCHQSHGWKLLTFDHNTQSAFVLTGAHKRVECRQCHREERRGAATFVRYKPMSTKCESCHA